MSKPAARLGDKDTGHPGAGPTPVITASSDVIINGMGAARKGDMLAPHHPGVRKITEGSSSVLINGRPAARVTDAINCGGKLIVGSGNTLIGDTPKVKGAATNPGPVKPFVKLDAYYNNSWNTPWPLENVIVNVDGSQVATVTVKSKKKS